MAVDFFAQVSVQPHATGSEVRETSSLDTASQGLTRVSSLLTVPEVTSAPRGAVRPGAQAALCVGSEISGAACIKCREQNRVVFSNVHQKYSWAQHLQLSSWCLKITNKMRQNWHARIQCQEDKLCFASLKKLLIIYSICIRRGWLVKSGFLFPQGERLAL